MSTVGLSVPVGAVLPYAGSLSDEDLSGKGWLFCDGSSLSRHDWAELYKAIGTCNGGDDSTCTFNLPDYRGRFLRGVDPKGSVDKGPRTAMACGGNTGNFVGSIEGSATASPTNAFTASVPHVPDGTHQANHGHDILLMSTPGPVTSGSCGGDSETRPINAYVNFIIKARPYALLPAGVVVPYAGSLSDKESILGWLFCDGSSLSRHDWGELYKAIGTTHGGDPSMSTFNLPDYRGRFLRGVDLGARNDPDANARTCMAPNGHTGDNVGSVQGYATHTPENPFTITLNLGWHGLKCTNAAGDQCSLWDSNPCTKDLTGGDNESRPVNLYVDYYILTQDEPSRQAIFPIGAVIGYPGDAAPPPCSHWLHCDGRSLAITQYQDLYDAIGTSNGGQGDHFNVPNYQGYFLRGTDHGRNRDPDAEDRTAASTGGNTGDNVGSLQSYATANAIREPFQVTIQNLPQHEAEPAYTQGTNHHTVANWGTATHSHPAGGGDAETRPINANILFYIKYAATTN